MGGAGPARRLLTATARAVNPPGGFADKAGRVPARAPGAPAEGGMSRSARGRSRFVRVLATLVTAGAMLPLAAASAGAATAGPSSPGRAQAGTGGVAPGAPGSMSYFDLARKDCVGTATGTASKVWYTVAGGVLSDTYEPTIDNTNVSTLQYVVTDGSSFTDLQ